MVAKQGKAWSSIEILEPGPAALDYGTWQVRGRGYTPDSTMGHLIRELQKVWLGGQAQLLFGNYEQASSVQKMVRFAVLHAGWLNDYDRSTWKQWRPYSTTIVPVFNSKGQVFSYRLKIQRLPQPVPVQQRKKNKTE